MKFDRAVAVYILNKDNKVLLLLHKKLCSWLPPGGHVEDNELIHEAAIREVEEETGLEIEFIYNTKDINDKNDEKARILPHPILVQLEDLGDHYHEDFVYLARAKCDEIINLENHQIGWFSIEEAKKLDTFDNVKRHLDHIETLI
ncbi:NUDIX domain-containing protein [Fonticella tunisiensis]|uniref:NUDIX domain-containing protein n=1 Tax=Fonticella tunisiensis TaxID=1096341 RepID=A0A4R7KAY4_9CLOT|nr:NUDIX domain-containing protein [Fonticella tunisiensis]TDT52062.1 NUDIX domain-containing protein [Fonticella tunisiensis]